MNLAKLSPPQERHNDTGGSTERRPEFVCKDYEWQRKMFDLFNWMLSFVDSLVVITFE